jgi:hypothetical protein
LASITIFLLILNNNNNNNKLKVSDWITGVISVFMVTQFRVDGILIALAFFLILYLRLIVRSLHQPYEEFLRPLLCFFVVIGIATLWIGGYSAKGTTAYGNSILQASGIIRLAVNPNINDSDPDDTKSMLKRTVNWEQYIRDRQLNYGISTRYIDGHSYRAGHKDIRLIYENIIQFLIVREEFFFEQSNIYGGKLPIQGGFMDNRYAHSGNFWQGDFNKAVHFANQAKLISEKSVQPRNPFYKTVASLHAIHKFPQKICWCFLPAIVLLLLAIVLYSYFPASACASALILSSFPLIFLISPLHLFSYYLFIFYGGLIIIPLMATEFRYRRYRKKEEEKDKSKVGEPSL